MARLVVITSLLALVQACSQRPWISEAEIGSLPNLKRYVEVASGRGQFDAGRIEQLAAAVAERELATANDRDAYSRILALGPCASELYWPLRRVSKQPTEAGAAASLLLLEQDLLESTEQLRMFRESPQGAWRAVGIRATQNASQRREVHRSLVDPDSRVRRAAIMTIQANPSPQDGPVLLEVVRLDPDESVRMFAVSALAETGDVQSMLLVRDTWDQMEEPLRLAFLEALDSPTLRRAGGWELLSRIMQNDDSMPGVVAASLLYRSQVAYSGLALGRLSRALRWGTSSEQLLALATVGLRESSLATEIAKRAREGAPYVRVAALELLLQVPHEIARSRKQLETIANSRDADANDANRVLALHGDPRAIARLEKRLGAAHAADRLATARVLVQIKQWNAVAIAVTDDHPAVRLATACQVLSRLGS
jgi:hypothetical protein